MNLFPTFLEYAKRIADEKLCGSNDIISLKHDGKVFATKEGADFSNLVESDIVEITNATEGKYALFNKVYALKEDVNAICYVHPEWVCAVAKKGSTIPAVLDDMAQIVGPTCKTAKNEASVLKMLKGRNSCLIKDDGCLTSGRTMDEAYTCALVLDKASHAFIAGSVLGGNVIIPLLEAKLMQIVYKKKYSKVNQQNLSEKEA